jgi:hypothetical protein
MAAVVWLPIELCGRAVLQSIRYASIFPMASTREPNRFLFRHLSRSLLLKFSMNAFWGGSPGAI